MPNYERIKASIQASTLESADKMKLTEYFADIPEDKLGPIADLFEKKKEWVERLHENRNKKMEAYKTFNQTLLEEVLEEEKNYLQDLAFAHD